MVTVLGAISRGLVVGGSDLGSFGLLTVLAGLLLACAPMAFRQLDG